MAAEDIADRAAVRNYVSLKSPGAAQQVFQQELAGARGLAVDGVVSAHHGTSMTLGDGSAKSRRVRIQLVVLAYVNVGEVARRFWTAMNGIVLGSGDDTVVARIVTLHPGNKRDGQAGG